MSTSPQARSSPLDELIMGEHTQLTDPAEKRIQQIYAGLPRSHQVLIATLSGFFHEGFYRQTLIEALEALKLTDLLDAVHNGRKLTVNLLVQAKCRAALGLGESDLPEAYQRVYQETARAILALRDRLQEDPDVRGWLLRSTSEEFHRLAAAWRENRGPTSSLTEMAMRPEYQQIIGMGRDAVPLLLQELRKTPDHWFWALVAITGEDPVPPEHKGKLSEMTKAWLQWGKDQGYLESNGT